MSVSDLDIYRSANLLIKQRSQGAPIFAAMQASKRAKAGPSTGAGCVVASKRR